MTDPKLSDTGVFATAQASKYLQQLCKHFAHKVEVTYGAQSGSAALPPGPASLGSGPIDLRPAV